MDDVDGGALGESGRPTIAQLTIAQLTIGVLGGTGAQGAGLVSRWVRAGMRVVIGSRSPARSAAAAATLAAATGSDRVTGTGNEECAELADVVVIAVPFEAQAALLHALRDRLAGKTVVSCVNPLAFDGGGGPHALRVAEGSAAQQAQALLPASHVTAAFHHLAAGLLADPAVPVIDREVLVLGDDPGSVATVRALAEAIPGVRGVDAGGLNQAGRVEALTVELITRDRRERRERRDRDRQGPDRHDVDTSGRVASDRVASDLDASDLTVGDLHVPVVTEPPEMTITHA
ncbi:NADPH-dependent F420 reductase [Allostreptomyces psammosilenae]|uniref:Pyrroline-5-carboxylate reductase catalytic N-terminal domain-containing protein n=1 Tax=Allostreptomyces psammosilenae TaxID=1892865 RepID=A0A852ZMG2_9ACTN|nr:NADPH-dependent F420 reductase [Allostreptomyces psammosilenae]NYI03589.1 hypothetical protein [Allostreptomyces psammosilenae]